MVQKQYRFGRTNKYNAYCFSSGNYQLYVNNSALACADTTVKTTITVLPLPIVVADPNQSVCQGTSVTLSASGAQDYNWDNGIQQGVSFVPATTTTYTVTGTSIYGCQNTDQVVVTVNGLPTAASNPDFAICAGETTSLTATGAIVVEWDNSVTNGVGFTPAATATYTAIVTDANGCKDTTETTITVNPLPVVDAGTNPMICAGESVELNATGADTYVWSNGSANGDAITPASSIVLTVVGMDVNGCSDDAQLSITVNALPNVFAGNDVEVCEGTLITLNATGAQDLDWSNGMTNNTSALLASGTYSVIGTDANGCSNSDTLEVVVNQNPVIDLGSDSTTCSNYGSIVLDAGSGFVSYDWNTNATAQTVSAFLTGTYEVTVTDNNGCTGADEVSLVFDPCLGIKENALEVSIYPNPTTNSVNVELTTAGFHYELRDVNGAILQLENIPGMSATVDFSNLAQGVYMLKVIQNEKAIIERIVKN